MALRDTQHLGTERQNRNEIMDYLNDLVKSHVIVIIHLNSEVSVRRFGQLYLTDQDTGQFGLLEGSISRYQFFSVCFSIAKCIKIANSDTPVIHIDGSPDEPLDRDPLIG